jgi:hypothetical protein
MLICELNNRQSRPQVIQSVTISIPSEFRLTMFNTVTFEFPDPLGGWHTLSQFCQQQNQLQQENQSKVQTDLGRFRLETFKFGLVVLDLAGQRQNRRLFVVQFRRQLFIHSFQFPFTPTQQHSNQTIETTTSMNPSIM